MQETWRAAAAESIQVGDWMFYGTGKKENRWGNGTGIMVHKTIKVKSWHHISPRITAVRIPYDRRFLMMFSAYAPVQQGGRTSPRTIQFYEQMADKMREARNAGDIVIGRGYEHADHARQRPSPNWKVGGQPQRRE